MVTQEVVPKEQSMKKLFSTICFVLIAGLTSQAHADKAINFNFTDSKGKTLKLSDYRGKWVLVNFWAPWCPRCKMEFPDLNDLDARPDFVVIGVAMDYGIDEASVQTTIQRYNLRFPQVIGGSRRDPQSPALQVGPVDYYPTSYLYAPDGEIVMFIPGIISKMKIVAFAEQHDKNALALAPASSGIQKTSISNAASPAQNKKKVTMY